MGNGSNTLINGTISVSSVFDWAFRILALSLPIVIAVGLDIQNRVTVIESNRYTAYEGYAVERKVTALEERCRALTARVEQLQREVDRLEGH